MPFTNDTNSISLSEMAAILRRRRGLIVGTFFVTIAAVALTTLAMPRQYETHMKVLVKNERVDMVVSPDRNARPVSSGEVGETEINSEIELLTSDDLLQQVVLRCGLDRRQHVPDASVAIEKAVKRLQRDLKVSAVRKASVILVEYADTDPRQAVAVLARLADLYLDQHLKIHGTPGTYAFFEGEAERYKQELKDSQQGLAELRSRENIVMPAEQKDVALQKAAEAQSALDQATASIGEYTQKVADTRQHLEAAQPRVVTQSRTSSNQYSVERLHTMLAELQNHRTQLLAKFRPEDRMVAEADQEIADTKAALEKAKQLTGLDEATDVNPVHQSLQIELDREQTELASIESRRQVLARQSWHYRQELMKIANASTSFDDLVRSQKEAEDNYLLYTKKAEEARVTESLDRKKISNVAIAETPKEPHLPSKPNVRLNLALGGLLAFFLSFGLAFIAEHLRATVEQARELRDVTGLPVLACFYSD